MTQQADPPTSRAKPRRAGGVLKPYRNRVRGRVLLMLCAMYFITYVDRVSISTAAPFIRDDLGLTNTQFGLVVSAFAVPYAFFQIFGGLLADRFGPRRLLTIVGVVWALATVFTGLATGLVTLFAARLALGFGEGAAFPGATQVMARWLPADQRAFGQGITHAASRLGNAIAPILVAGIIALFDWRAAFWVLGAVSLCWTGWWLRSFRDRPADHPKMTPAELAELSADQLAEARPAVPWVPLLRRVLPLTFVDFCYGWMLWVYLTWVPSFFADGYGLELSQFALFSSLVLAAGVIGDLLGGTLSDELLRRTGSLRIARRLVLVGGLLGSLVFIVPAMLSTDLTVVAICLALAFFFLEMTNPVLWSIPMDLAPAHAGTAAGMMNTGFGIAGILSPVVFGLLVDRSGGWTVPFLASAGLLLVGGLTALRIDPTNTLPAHAAPGPEPGPDA